MKIQTKTLAQFVVGSMCASLLMAAHAEPVDINLASADALAQNIVGVGPVTAQKIISYREEHGGFQTVDELMNISGVGIKVLEANQDVLMIDGKVPQN